MMFQIILKSKGGSKGENVCRILHLQNSNGFPLGVVSFVTFLFTRKEKLVKKQERKHSCFFHLFTLIIRHRKIDYHSVAA